MSLEALTIFDSVVKRSFDLITEILFSGNSEYATSLYLNVREVTNQYLPIFQYSTALLGGLGIVMNLYNLIMFILYQ